MEALFINELEAATLLGLSAATIRRWRSAWKAGHPFGPTPHWFSGSVRYNRNEVVAWADTQAVSAATPSQPEQVSTAS